MCLYALGQTNVGALEDKRGPDIGDRDEGELVQTTCHPLKVTDKNIGELAG